MDVCLPAAEEQKRCSSAAGRREIVIIHTSIHLKKVFDTYGRDSSFSSARLHKNRNVALLSDILALGQKSAQNR
jgi:hypothetical protein